MRGVHGSRRPGPSLSEHGRLAALLLVALAGCTSGAPVEEKSPSGEAANHALDEGDHAFLEFTGHADPSSGTLVIDTVNPTEEGRAVQALTSLNVDPGRSPGMAATNSVQLTVSNTRSDVRGCGRADSVCSDVQIRSFYTNAIPNVYAEIQSMVPSTGNEAYNSAPSAFGLSNVLGLWSYGNLTAAGGSGDRATQTWGFNSLSGTGFTFRGRVMGDLGFANYTLATNTTTTFVNACTQAGATTGLLANADDSALSITLPFSFNFYNYGGTAAWISSNGVLGIGSTSSTAYANTCMPNSTLPVGTVLAFFDDLQTRSTGVCTALVGTYPNRQFVVTWNDAQFYGDSAGASHLTFSVVLNEVDSTIDVVYGTLSTTDSTYAARVFGSSATIGLWDHAGSRGAEELCNTALLSAPPFALHFTPHLCGAGTHQCGSTCVSDTSVNNCGAICSVCPGGASLNTCDGWVCNSVCTTGQHACLSSCVSNNSVANCGNSCSPCPSVPNSTSTCDGVSCGFTCNSGYHACSGACLANTSTLGCGSSCTPCTVPANASATCNGTTCGYTCNAGYADCNGLASDGCEVNLNTDPNNCGACSTGCSGNHATPACVAGSCTSPCATGWGDCNGNRRSDGCETDVTTTTNCGTCGTACSGSNVVGSACVAGACSGTCATGFGNCDGNLQSNGCETNTQTSISNCGACGTACAGTNVTGSACVAGACTGTCAASYTNCDSNLQSNGCESNTTVDPNNCGGCGTVCSSNNVASRTCSANVCNGTCSTGFANCDSDMRTDGCETSTTTTTNCGGCARACSATNTASLSCSTGGLCNSTCAAGFGNCTTPAAPAADDGCETNIATTSNCGGCGRACSSSNVATLSCSSGGLCNSTCSAGRVNCSTPSAPTADDGCECAGTACCSGGTCQTSHTTTATALTASPRYDCNGTGVNATNAQSWCTLYVGSACTSQALTQGSDSYQAYCGSPTAGGNANKCGCWVYSTSTGGSRVGNVYQSNNTSCSLSGSSSGTWN